MGRQEKTIHRAQLTAHVDTLGAMVKEIKSNGRLKITRIGGAASQWRLKPKAVGIHIERQKDARLAIDRRGLGARLRREGQRDKTHEDHMEIRLDARTSSEKETRELGINIGDFVAFEPARRSDERICPLAVSRR